MQWKSRFTYAFTYHLIIELTNYRENNERTNIKTTSIVIYTKTFRPKNIGLRRFKKLTENTGYLTSHSERGSPAKCN